MTNPQIIAAVQEKGGVGKSMILCALAAHLANDGIRATIVDTDPQATCLHWSRTNEVGVDTHSCLDDEALPTLVDRLGRGKDVVLIDTAGYKSAMAVYAIQMADLVLVPMSPSMPDVRGAVNVWRHAVNAAKAARRTVTVRIVVNHVNPQARITREVLEAARAADMPLVQPFLPELTGFREMLTHGGPPTGRARTAFSGLVSTLQQQGDLFAYARPPAVVHETRKNSSIYDTHDEGATPCQHLI